MVGGESLSQQDLIQCFLGWKGVHITTWSRLRDTFPQGWNVSLSSRMPNRALKGFLPSLRCLEQGRYVILRVWWLWRRGINFWCNLCTIEAASISLFSALEPLLSSLYVRSEELYIFFLWRRSQIAHTGTWVTQLTWVVSLCCTCRLFDSMLKVIIAAIYWNLMSGNSRTVQKTVETLKMYRTNTTETSATN
jgi:hypothetical protein